VTLDREPVRRENELETGSEGQPTSFLPSCEKG